MMKLDIRRIHEYYGRRSEAAWKRKLAAIIIVLGTGIWIGMNGATEGIERIHGPFPTHSEAPLHESYPLVVEEVESMGYERGGRQSPYPAEETTVREAWSVEQRPSIMEKAADQTGVLVQRTAQKSLEALIDWFELVTD